MKKVILTSAAVLAAFAVGLIGTYVAMPMLAPDVVASAQAHADSSAAAPSAAGSLAALPDSSAADSSAALELPEAASALVQAFKDSMQTLRGQLRQADERTAALRQQAETFRQQVAALQDQRAQASQLSGSLTKMEEQQLSALLRQVDPRVLDRLYMEATGRTRTRLLQAMPPSRAARFVNRLVEPVDPAPMKISPAETLDGAASSAPGPSEEQALSAASN